MSNHLSKRFTLAVLTAVYSLNLVDRSLIGLLLQPIKIDLHLSDTQLGFVTGIAFALFYATLGVPIARWADRGNRVTICSAALAIGGIAVSASILITTYFQLVIARIAAAVGEAGCKPPSYSLVGDFFPGSAERTRAMAIYHAGGAAAASLAYVVGGWVNELYGWRTTLLVVGGLPCLVIALVARLTVVEPRTQTAKAPGSPVHQLPMIETLSVLWGSRSFRHLSLALILIYTMGSGLGPWKAVYLMRIHHMGTGELGAWLGAAVGIGSVASILLGGYLASHWLANNERAQMWMCGSGVALLVPCYVAFLTVPQKHQALLILIPIYLLPGLYIAPTYVLMQRLVPNEMRATALASVMLFVHLIGIGVGTQVVGILSDALASTFGHASLRYAMLAVSSVAIWAAYHFWKAGQTIVADLSAANRGRRHVRTDDLDEIVVKSTSAS